MTTHNSRALVYRAVEAPTHQKGNCAERCTALNSATPRIASSTIAAPVKLISFPNSLNSGSNPMCVAAATFTIVRSVGTATVGISSDLGLTMSVVPSFRTAVRAAPASL